MSVHITIFIYLQINQYYRESLISTLTLCGITGRGEVGNDDGCEAARSGARVEQEGQVLNLTILFCSHPKTKYISRLNVPL